MKNYNNTGGTSLIIMILFIAAFLTVAFVYEDKLMNAEGEAEVEAVDSDDRYRTRAREMYAAQGAVEIDADAKVSRSADESGAYVQMWVWVGRESAGFEPGPLEGGKP